MRRRYSLACTALLAIGAIALAGPALAQDEPYPIELSAGETFDVCASGLIICPARAPICDDPNIAVPVDVSGVLGFRGVGPGTTLCSATSSVGPRRVFRITVR
jgi:hypothetical protein